LENCLLLLAYAGGIETSRQVHGDGKTPIVGAGGECVPIGQRAVGLVRRAGFADGGVEFGPDL